MENEEAASVSSDNPGSKAHGDPPEGGTIATLSSIREVVSEVMAKGMYDLKSEMKKELGEFRDRLRQDIKAQIEDLTVEINQKMQDATDQIEEATRCLGDVEKSLVGMEKWDIGVKDTLIQLVNNQPALQNK